MRKGLFWFLAVVITLGSAVFQRMTGPTHPLRGKVVVEGTEVAFKLPRSAETVRDAEVAVPAPAPLQGYLEYMRFKTEDAWARVPLARQGDRLVGRLPKQPAAGKLAYRVLLSGGYLTTPIAGEDPVIIRFKDPVPVWIIVPHVLVIFAGMLLATAAGLAALDKKRNPRRLVLWTVALLFAGGLVLGPLVQKFAFGVAWSGFPLGMDLTDNKTLIAFLFWIAALLAGRKGKPARPFVIAASLVTLLIFLIPHSLLGSELDYSKME
ncbi:MAG: hypothetical protein A2V57_05205 [Candidatus Aminicenantes bacterium RBG_19FT_COMBO_65_30]|nr:MAG: hypothetical protein A2V57_05205 [Candidatus Aminicenantes bacterium RBG_19FT_COMBO_65_30]